MLLREVYKSAGYQITVCAASCLATRILSNIAISFQECRSPDDFGYVISVPMLFQNETEGQRHEGGLDAIERGARDFSRLYPSVQQGFICLALQSFAAFKGSMFFSKMEISCTGYPSAKNPFRKKEEAALICWKSLLYLLGSPLKCLGFFVLIY